MERSPLRWGSPAPPQLFSYSMEWFRLVTNTPVHGREGRGWASNTPLSDRLDAVSFSSLSPPSPSCCHSRNTPTPVHRVGGSQHVMSSLVAVHWPHIYGIRAERFILKPNVNILLSVENLKRLEHQSRLLCECNECIHLSNVSFQSKSRIDYISTSFVSVS